MHYSTWPFDLEFLNHFCDTEAHVPNMPQELILSFFILSIWEKMK